MHRVLPMCLDAAIAAAALVYPFVLLDRHCFHNPKRSAGYLALSVYLCAVFAMVGLPDIRYIRWSPNVNLIPFKYFFSDRTSGWNVVLFLPLGVFLPVLWQRFRNGFRTALFGLCTSAFIEVLQLFTYRATDINDLITNSLGTLLGWCLARALLHLFPRIHPSDKTREVYIVCAVTVGFMILLHPLLADPIWSLLIR